MEELYSNAFALSYKKLHYPRKQKQKNPNCTCSLFSKPAIFFSYIDLFFILSSDSVFLGGLENFQKGVFSLMS